MLFISKTTFKNNEHIEKQDDCFPTFFREGVPNPTGTGMQTGSVLMRICADETPHERYRAFLFLKISHLHKHLSIFS